MNRDFYEMQRDAVNRVKDMQKKARDTLSGQQKPPTQNECKNNKPKMSNIINTKHFEGSHEDLLILSLVILLADEGADIMLILALMYLIF